MKKHNIIGLITLCVVALLMFTACGGEKSETVMISEEANKSTHGLNEFPLGEHIKLKTPEGYVKPTEYTYKIGDGFLAEITFTNKQSDGKLIMVRISPSDSDEAKLYEKCASGEKEDGVTYEEVETDLGKLYFAYKPGEKTTCNLDGKYFEGKEGDESSLYCVSKLDEGILYVELDNSSFDIDSGKVTVYPISNEDYNFFKEYVKTIR